MRKIIISFCFLLAVLSLKAQSVNGIRIDGGNTPILVYLGGSQVSLPATSCFVANLKPGYYTVEVYATRSARAGERLWKGQRLYNQRIYFNGNGVKDIRLDGRNHDIRPVRPDEEEHRPTYNQYDRVMDEDLFSTFFQKVKKEPFSDNRLKMIEAALTTSDFTSGQCAQLAKLYPFDDDRMKVMKMMYPRIVDKEAFFVVVDVLTFSSNKNKMNEFVKDYGRRRNH